MLCFLGRADFFLESVVEFLCNDPIDGKWGDATKQETRSKDETDVGEVEGENVRHCESKNAANGNVANHWLESDEVGLAKCIEDTGDKVAEHESNVEGEKKEHKADVVLWLGNLQNWCKDKMPPRDGDEP